MQKQYSKSKYIILLIIYLITAFPRKIFRFHNTFINSSILHHIMSLIEIAQCIISKCSMCRIFILPHHLIVMSLFDMYTLCNLMWLHVSFPLNITPYEWSYEKHSSSPFTIFVSLTWTLMIFNHPKKWADRFVCILL